MSDEELLCVTWSGSGDSGAGAASAFVPRGPHGAGVPLFLAPGFGLDGRSFHPLTALAADRRVVFWNLPNELPRSGGVDALARLYLDHADRAGMPRRFAFGGGSLGGTIALAAASIAPERCAGLVVLGSCARWRDLGRFLRFGRFLFPWIPARGFHGKLARILFGPAGRSPTLDALRNQAMHRTKAHAGAVIARLHGDGPFDLVPRLHLVKGPTLVVHDPEDRVVPIEGGRTVAGIAGAVLAEIEGAGHLPQLGATEECLSRMRTWLSRIDEAERHAAGRRDS